MVLLTAVEDRVQLPAMGDHVLEEGLPSRHDFPQQMKDLATTLTW